jgi:hypothetical protein
VPLSATANAGLTGSLLLIVNVAVNAPVTVGRNLTAIWQVRPTANVAPHPPATRVKLVAFGPVMVMLLMFKVPLHNLF